MSGLGALAVNDRGRRARRAPFALARADMERMVDALQRAIPVPQREVAMRGALRRQVLWQGRPLAGRRKLLEDCVENFPDIHIARSAAALGRWNQRAYQRPFGVSQITLIAQAFAIVGTTMFWRPHAAPSFKPQVPHRES